MPKHLTEIELELARTEEADRAVVAHLEACAACQERMVAIEETAALLGQPLEPVKISTARDQAIVELAQTRAAAIRRRAERRPRRTARTLAWAVPLAAAAVVALLLVVPQLTGQPGATPASTPVAAGPDDVNRDGRIDILDAFELARAIKGGPAGHGHDANRDGRVDSTDVDQIAMAAVALGPKGGSR
jgi:predicted anti-sigma-YlaC factor YlaD